MLAIYGANGFIGRHVVSRLVASGHSVRAVSRKFDTPIAAAWGNAVDMVEADFTNPLSMLSSLQDVDTVVQLISSSSPGMGNKVLVEDIKENVIPHVSFMRNAAEAGVKKYVFISSGGTVYGPDASVPTPETARTNPINSHGMTKLTIEKYLQMFGKVEGLDYVILRVSNPFGPGQSFRKGQGLIPAILQRHREGRAVQIFGDGHSQRDYLYISDLVAAIDRVVSRPDIRNEVINIGKGKGRSVLEVLTTIEASLGTTLEKEFIPDRGTDVSMSILDITKAKAVLSWAPEVSFEAGIRMMLGAER